MLTRAGRKRAGAPSPPPLFPNKARQGSPQLAATANHTVHTQERSQRKATQNESLESNDEAVWAQCENKKCLKWRRIAKEAAGSLPDVWYCRMHPNPSLQSCEAPEEQWHLEKNELFTYHGLKEGQLVWAKLANYPPWPAIVSCDPWCNNDFVSDEKEAGGLIYHVEFLGKPPTHTWLPEEMVEPYRDLCSLQLSAPICPREVMSSNKRLQTAIQAADSLLLESPSKRLQCLHYTTSLCQGGDKKKSQTAPAEESKNPTRGRPKKPKQSTASAVLRTTTEGATMVPLHTLPDHVQHSVMESQTVLFKLLEPVDGQTRSAIQVLASKPAASICNNSKKPLAELNNSQAPASHKTIKTRAVLKAGNAAQLTKKPTTKHPSNGRPSLAQSLLSCAKQTNSLTQVRKRTLVATSRAVEPNKKKRKTKSKDAAQSTTIKQYFTQTTTAPPSQAVDHPAADQVVPTMAAGVLIDNLEDEMRNGLNEIESLLNTMTAEECTSEPTSSCRSAQEKEPVHGCSLSLAAQTDRALQDLADIEELMREIG